jgi:hypothetical protein
LVVDAHWCLGSVASCDQKDAGMSLDIVASQDL